MPRASAVNAMKKKKKHSLYVHKPALKASTVTTGSKTGYLRSITLPHPKIDNEPELELVSTTLPDIPDGPSTECDISLSNISGITVKLPAKRYTNS
ncbi:hypothetical protein H0H92_012428, partial [Tricholoma furcatifolium]